MDEKARIDQLIREMKAQGLHMEPENNGESVEILTDLLASLSDDFEAISSIDG